MYLNKLPQPDAAIREDYNTLTANLENSMDSLTKSFFQNALNCKPGCAECCMAFSVLPLEAAIIADRLNGKKLPPTLPPARADEKCCFLNTSLCSIYDIRPVICRTQGLPIGYIHEESGTIEVSCCPLNFADDYQFTSDELLFLDTFNSELARLNMLYCQNHSLDPLQRIALSDIIKIVQKKAKKPANC